MNVMLGPLMYYESCSYEIIMDYTGEFYNMINNNNVESAIVIQHICKSDIKPPSAFDFFFQCSTLDSVTITYLINTFKDKIVFDQGTEFSSCYFFLLDRGMKHCAQLLLEECGKNISSDDIEDIIWPKLIFYDIDVMVSFYETKKHMISKESINIAAFVNEKFNSYLNGDSETDDSDEQNYFDVNMYPNEDDEMDCDDIHDHIKYCL